MTVQELSRFCQKDDKTIRRWIKKAGAKCPALLDKMSISGHGKACDFTVEEVGKILKASTMSSDAVAILMANANTSDAPTSKGYTNISDEQAKIISQIVASTVISVMSQFTGQLQQNQKALPPTPIKDARAHVCELVRNYAKNSNLSYRDVYTMLYTEYGYRTHSNPSRSALNRQMPIIDYLDSIGQMETLEAVAIDYLVCEKKFKRGYLAE